MGTRNQKRAPISAYMYCSFIYVNHLKTKTCENYLFFVYGECAGDSIDTGSDWCQAVDRVTTSLDQGYSKLLGGPRAQEWTGGWSLYRIQPRSGCWPLENDVIFVEVLHCVVQYVTVANQNLYSVRDKFQNFSNRSPTDRILSKDSKMQRSR